MNKDDVDAVDILCEEILKYIKRAVKEKTVSDRTYRTIIRNITKKGYVVLDDTGQERTVLCGIPNVELRVGQSVYVKEPSGKLNELYICNVVGSTSNSNNSSRSSRRR